MKKLILILTFFSHFIFASELQEAINKAPEGSKITLAQGEYLGNIVINKPLTLDGVDKKAKIVGD